MMRKIKNIVMIILIFLLIGMTTFTVFFIKNNSNVGGGAMDFGNMDVSGEMPSGETGEMPEAPGGETVRYQRRVLL